MQTNKNVFERKEFFVITMIILILIKNIFDPVK